LKIDNRTVTEQLNSAAMLGLKLIASIVVLAMLVKGLGLMAAGKHWLPGFALVLSATVILWLTAAIWVKWFFMISLGLVMRGVVAGLLAFFYPKENTTWVWLLVAFAVTMVMLTMRFFDNQTPNALDKICLAAAIPAALELLFTRNLLWLAIAPGFLLLAYAYRRVAARRYYLKDRGL